MKGLLSLAISHLKGYNVNTLLGELDPLELLRELTEGNPRACLRGVEWSVSCVLRVGEIWQEGGGVTALGGTSEGGSRGRGRGIRPGQGSVWASGISVCCPPVGLPDKRPQNPAGLQPPVFNVLTWGSADGLWFNWTWLGQAGFRLQGGVDLLSLRSLAGAMAVRSVCFYGDRRNVGGQAHRNKPVASLCRHLGR